MRGRPAGVPVACPRIPRGRTPAPSSSSVAPRVVHPRRRPVTRHHARVTRSLVSRPPDGRLGPEVAAGRTPSPGVRPDDPAARGGVSAASAIRLLRHRQARRISASCHVEGELLRRGWTASRLPRRGGAGRHHHDGPEAGGVGLTREDRGQAMWPDGSFSESSQSLRPGWRLQGRGERPRRRPRRRSRMPRSAIAHPTGGAGRRRLGWRSSTRREERVVDVSVRDRPGDGRSGSSAAPLAIAHRMGGANGGCLGCRAVHPDAEAAGTPLAATPSAGGSRPLAPRCPAGRRPASRRARGPARRAPPPGRAVRAAGR